MKEVRNFEVNLFADIDLKKCRDIQKDLGRQNWFSLIFYKLFFTSKFGTSFISLYYPSINVSEMFCENAGV